VWGFRAAQTSFREIQGVILTQTRRAPAEQEATKGRTEHEALLQAFRDGFQIVQDGGWPPWSPLVQPHDRDSDFCAEVGCDYSFANSRYQVLVNFEQAPGWPPLVHLRIKAHDKRCVRDWRDMQRIKNEICGTEAEGVELYPEEGRLVDEVNEFHIYVLHPAATFPFGRQSRATATPEQSAKDAKGEEIQGRPWQRTFESHHNAEGCLPRGQIQWSEWSPGNSPGQPD
jgi:hypothetical protein